MLNQGFFFLKKSFFPLKCVAQKMFFLALACYVYEQIEIWKFPLNKNYVLKHSHFSKK